MKVSQPLHAGELDEKLRLDELGAAALEVVEELSRTRWRAA